VVYYEWAVPEEERCESAVRRRREELEAELQLWEKYLEKVATHTHTHTCTHTHTHTHTNK